VAFGAAGNGGLEVMEGPLWMIISSNRFKSFRVRGGMVIL
jgi:hypothetical protein